jgi:enamine deaminase RidA (YjgF/YER057c/UK114 family)
VDSPEEMRENEAIEKLEAQLRKALERVDAPPTLIKFLETAIEAQEHQKRTGKLWFRPQRGGLLLVMPKPWRWMMSPWAGGAVAALLVAGVFMTGEHVHRMHERQAEATQQFEQATQITDRALERAREKMRKAGVNLDQ